VVIGGMMTGVMYSLVALGFVLIFKASSVFNFAQGVFALCCNDTRWPYDRDSAFRSG